MEVVRIHKDFFLSHVTRHSCVDDARVVGDNSCHGHTDGLVQDYSNSSALVIESLQSCTKPSNYLAQIRITHYVRDHRVVHSGHGRDRGQSRWTQLRAAGCRIQTRGLGNSPALQGKFGKAYKVFTRFCCVLVILTHWGRENIVSISQKTF